MKNHSEMRAQFEEQRRKVDFDSYDVTVDELIRRVEKERIEIAPVYQRQFRWDDVRQSTLVESFLLGIPVPPLFMATNITAGEKSQWEVVDGLQRLLTLVRFAGDQPSRVAAGLPDKPLRLTGLEKLTNLNGVSFDELPKDIQTTLEDRPAKVTVLNDKSSKQIRFDLFERLNTGGLVLTDQEVRECVYRGDFIDTLVDLSAFAPFKQVVNIQSGKQNDGTAQEFVLRFFAFLSRYKEFDHSVKDFLNDFTEDASGGSVNYHPMIQEFKETFEFLAECFPDGIKRNNRATTPTNLYEGVVVGAALALREIPGLSSTLNPTWVTSDILKKFTTGATNSRLQVKNRIEFCLNRFLGRDA